MKRSWSTPRIHAQRGSLARSVLTTAARVSAAMPVMPWPIARRATPTCCRSTPFVAASVIPSRSRSTRYREHTSAPMATVERSTMSCMSSSQVGAVVPSCTISRSAASSSRSSAAATTAPDGSASVGWIVVIAASSVFGCRQQLDEQRLLDVEPVLRLVEHDRGWAVERLVRDLFPAVGRQAIITSAPGAWARSAASTRKPAKRRRRRSASDSAPMLVHASV